MMKLYRIRYRYYKGSDVVDKKCFKSLDYVKKLKQNYDNAIEKDMEIKCHPGISKFRNIREWLISRCGAKDYSNMKRVDDSFDKMRNNFINSCKMLLNGTEFKLEFPDYDINMFDNDEKFYFLSIEMPLDSSIDVIIINDGCQEGEKFYTINDMPYAE